MQKLKLILTGSSSFTGCWLAESLLQAGHEVHATLTQPDPAAYPPARRSRLARISRHPGLVWVPSSPFGSPNFLRHLESGRPFDGLCHHGAQVGDYTNPLFPVAEAVAANTLNLDQVCRSLRESAARFILCSGSYFEPGEGRDGPLSPAFSPYGLAKSESWERVREAALQHHLTAAKFVFPNPFGPGEERGLTTALIRAWAAAQTPSLLTPQVRRDHVPAPFLASSYRDFVAQVASWPTVDPQFPLRQGCPWFAPSLFTESVSQFASRCAREFARRRPGLYPLPAPPPQPPPLSEPIERFNPHPISPSPHAIQEFWTSYTAWAFPPSPAG